MNTEDKLVCIIEKLDGELTSARSRIEELEGALREIANTATTQSISWAGALEKSHDIARQALSGKSEFVEKERSS